MQVFGTVSAQLFACMMLFCVTYAVKFTKLAIFEQHLYCAAFPQAFSSNSGCTEQTSGLICSNEQAYLDFQELFA